MVGVSEASIDTGLGGTLLLHPMNYFALTVPTSGLDLDLTIPDDCGLPGSLYLQALELDPGASQGVSFTRGLNLILGFDVH